MRSCPPLLTRRVKLLTPAPGGYGQTDSFFRVTEVEDQKRLAVPVTTPDEQHACLFKRDYFQLIFAQLLERRNPVAQADQFLVELLQDIMVPFAAQRVVQPGLVERI